MACATLLVTAGCQHKAASKLAGRWDMQSTEVEGQQAAENAQELHDYVGNGESTGTMSLVFHRNGKLETYTDFAMASSRKPKIGTWKLASWDEATQIAIIECELLDETTETRVLFVDDDTIELVPPNIAVLEQELRFRRVK